MNMMGTAKEKYFNGDRGPDLRMTPPGERRTFEVSKMWERHHEITRLLLLGMTGVEIAERMGISEAMVNYTRNSKIVKDKLDLMKGARDAETVDLSKEIRMKAPKALKLLETIIDGQSGTLGELASPALRAKTAENWMDRAGYPAQRSGTGIQLHAHFDAQDLIEVKKRAKESGIVIDAEEITCEAIAE